MISLFYDYYIHIRPDPNRIHWWIISSKWVSTLGFDVVIIVVTIVFVDLTIVVAVSIVVTIIWLVLLKSKIHAIPLTMRTRRPRISMRLHAHAQIHVDIYVCIRNYLNVNIKWKLIIFLDTRITYRTVLFGSASHMQINTHVETRASHKNHLRNYFTLISESHAFCPSTSELLFYSILAACSLQPYHFP